MIGTKKTTMDKGGQLNLSLEATKELLFLLCCLEASMAKLGGCIDELKFDLLKSHTRSLFEKRLTKGDDPLLGSNTTSLNHQVVTLHDTVVRETTHGSNVLLSPVSNKGSKIRDKIRELL